MSRFFALVSLLALAGLLCAPAGAADLQDDVRPFISIIEDAAVASDGYAEGQFRYMSYENYNAIGFGGLGAYRVAPQVEAGARLAFASVDPDQGDSESGLTDLDLYARFTATETAEMRIAVGGLINLPVGSEDIAEGTFDFEGFGAIRYGLENLTFLGHFGFRINGELDRNGHKTDRETQFLFGGGVLFAASEQATVTGEFTFRSKEYEGGEGALQLTPGIDFALPSGLRLRGAMALGLTDGAADIELIAGVAIPFAQE
ncbi:MAG: hypothetical protein KAY32_05345 [Candidatus Eisenbacteria sp.]|nr:hypothetical protein [Candidatus Eisenbacteria bacterium]